MGRDEGPHLASTLRVCYATLEGRELLERRKMEENETERVRAGIQTDDGKAELMTDAHRERIRLSAGMEPHDADESVSGFEIMAITSGSGNGWQFPADALQASLPLWDGVESYIDHAQQPGWNRSVRDLAGVCRSPQWDAERQGIKLRLDPTGPGAEMLSRLGKEWLEKTSSRGDLGFSADISFTASGQTVAAILKVHSLDLVMKPARGGRFLGIFENQNKGAEKVMDKDVTGKSQVDEAALIKDQQVLSMQNRIKEQRAQMAGDQKLVNVVPESFQIQMCSMLLESTLTTAKLPDAVESRIRRQFSGKIFDAAELTLAVEDGRALAAELAGGKVISGGRVERMFDTRDQLQAACDDLLGAPREKGIENLRPARLSGIRELYLMLTGDDDLHGGYYPERVRFASTTDFSGLVKNSLNKIVVNRWEELGRAGYDWWQRIVSVEHFNTLNQITGTLVGTVGALPEVAEGAAYTELVIGDSPETADWKKYGGYIPLTLELIDRDETRKLRAYPRELASAGLRKISALVAALFTQSSGTGPALADGGALFNNTAVSTAGGHKNLLTGALSAAEWETVSTAVYNQPMLIKNAAGVYGTGPRMAVNPRFCLVPRALQLTAMKILYPSLENAANIYSENLQRGQPGDVITVPEWTDANDWAAVCDPRVAPAIFLGERFGLMPEVFIAGDELSPAVFTNDEHRLKVRHFLAAWVNDYRPLHKSNVA